MTEAVVLTIRGFIEAEELELIVYENLKRKGITLNDYPIDPYELIKNEGILLQETNIQDSNIRGMIVHGENATGILINSNRCPVSKRFIAMHELSHHWFHPHDAERVCFEKYRKLKKGIEWQANNAAAYALMPTEVLTDLYDYCNGNLNYMCKKLEVSMDSLNYRLADLKLKPRIQIKNTNKSIVNNITLCRAPHY